MAVLQLPDVHRVRKDSDEVQSIGNYAKGLISRGLHARNMIG